METGFRDGDSCMDINACRPEWIQWKQGMSSLPTAELGQGVAPLSSKSTRAQPTWCTAKSDKGREQGGGGGSEGS